MANGTRSPRVLLLLRRVLYLGLRNPKSQRLELPFHSTEAPKPEGVLDLVSRADQ